VPPFVVDVSVARSGLTRPKHVGVLIILISECFKKCILSAKSRFLKYKISTLARLRNKKNYIYIYVCVCVCVCVC
jgi:hypothetical protein